MKKLILVLCWVFQIHGNPLELFSKLGSEKFDLATLDNLMQNADVYMTALGATRVKRDAGYDKEFSFNKNGLNVGIAYRGTSDQAGKVYFQVKDIRIEVEYEISRQAEGLFSLNINFDIEGKTANLIVSNKKDDEGQHQTKISLESNYLKFYLSGVSDYETKAEFIVKYEYDDEEKSHNEDLKIMGFREENKKFKFVFIRNTKIYSVEVNANIADLNGDILIKTPDRDYRLNGKATIKGDWKILVEGDVKGAVSLFALIKNDYTEAKFELKHNNKKMMQMKVKGKEMSNGSVEVKTKYSLLEGKAGKGDLDATYHDGVLDVEIRPKNRPVVNTKIHWLPQYVDAEKSNMKHLEFGFDATSKSKSMAKYTGVLERVNTDEEYGTKFHSDFEVTKNNRIYIIMCKLGERLGSGCFNTRKMSVETHINKKSDNVLLNNFKFFVNNQKDDETNFEIDLHGLDSPYQFKVMTPYLTEYLDQDTFLLTATHTPKQQMTFTSSYLDLVLDFTRGDDNQGGLDGKKFAAEFTKSGVTQLTYDLFIFYDREENVKTEIKANSNLFMKTDSAFYDAACEFDSGCFNTRTASLDLFADHNQNSPAVSLDVDIANDGKRILKTGFKTKEAGGIFTATITSTDSALESLIFSLNLAAKTGDVKKNGQKIYDIVVGSETSLETKAGWESNRATVKLTGDGDADITADVDWDGKGHLKVDANGYSSELGQFIFKRILDIKKIEKGVALKVTGNTEVEKGYIDFLNMNKIPINIDLVFNSEDLLANGIVGESIKISNSNIIFI